MLIRDAQEADLPAMLAIYADAVTHLTATFDLDAPDVAAFARQFEAVTQAGLPWLVCETDGVIAGYAYAAPAKARLGWRFTVENSIYVAEDARGKGVGRLLLHALIKKAEALGLRQMIAVIGDSRNLASIALHRGAGFEHAGTMRAVGRKHGRWLDVVMMQRALGDGDGSAPDGDR